MDCATIIDSVAGMAKAVETGDTFGLRQNLARWPSRSTVQATVASLDPSRAAILGAILADHCPDATLRRVYRAIGRVWTPTVAMWLADTLTLKIDTWARCARRGL